MALDVWQIGNKFVFHVNIGDAQKLIYFLIRLKLRKWHAYEWIPKQCTMLKKIGKMKKNNGKVFFFYFGVANMINNNTDCVHSRKLAI